MKEDEVKALQAGYVAAGSAAGVKNIAADVPQKTTSLGAILAWAAVGIPLVWGIWITLEKALALFQ
jgi:hypothetical protein